MVVFSYISNHIFNFISEAPVNDPNSAGNTIWGRVVNAAGSLTLNVSKAWENGISLQDGRGNEVHISQLVTRV